MRLGLDGVAPFSSWAFKTELFVQIRYKRTDKVLKMKLATILAASVAAETERHFSTGVYNTEHVDDWWNLYPKIPEHQMTKLKTTTEPFFNAYFEGRPVAERYIKKWTRLQNDMESAAEDCSADRKRRNAAQEERFMKDFNADYIPDNPKSDFYAYSEGHARWIIKEIRDGCPDKAQALLRRADRLRIVMHWRFCKNYKDLPVVTKDNKEDDPVGFCWWALYDWNGNLKGHPRKSWSKFAEGGVYSINGPQ